MTDVLVCPSFSVGSRIEKSVVIMTVTTVIFGLWLISLFGGVDTDAVLVGRETEYGEQRLAELHTVCVAACYACSVDDFLSPRTEDDPWCHAAVTGCRLLG